jgi:peptidoglycan/xylan/chitin deacetylase (PgdA/CDA1 family)
VLGTAIAAAAVLFLRLTRRRVGIALVYHSLGVRPGDPASDVTAPHEAALVERQLRHLTACYRVVDAAQIVTAAGRRRRGERFPVAVTFDDDLRSHAQLALPILERAGLRATFFLCGASLEKPFEFWWERFQRANDAGLAGPSGDARERFEALKRMSPAERDAELEGLAPGPPPLDAGMRTPDVRALAAAGMAIGFHTRRHDLLTALDDDELAEAMRDGREELAALAGPELETIAYPHGAHDERVRAAARNAGFRLGFSAAGNPVRPDSDPLSVPRIVPTYRSTGHFALQLLQELLER